MQVRKASRFVAINGSHANQEKNSVDLLFLGEDGQHYAIEMDPAVIPATLVAATGHLSELSSSQSQDLQSQALQAKGMDIVMGGDGSIALQLKLQSDLKLNIQVTPDQAPALAAILEDLNDFLTRKVQ